MSARELVETGVEWLRQLPEDWTVVPIGRECWVRARLGWKGLKADEYVDSGGFPMLSTPDIKGRDIDFRSASRITKARFDESPEIMLHVGDVLLTKDGSTIGTANIVRDLPEPTTLNGSIALLTPSKTLDGRYLYYVIVSEYAQKVFDRLRGGAGVPHLFQRDINRIRIPRPPLVEQRAIADYLDHETAQIDALVAKQEELVTILRERRSSVVDLALSSGSSAQIRLKNLLIRNDGGVWGEDAIDGTGTVVLRSTEQTVDGRWRIADPAIRSLTAKEFESARLEPGDLVVTKTSGSSKHIGKTTIVDDEVASLPACFGNFMQRLRGGTGTSPRFLWYCLNSRIVREQFDLLSTTSTGLSNLNASTIGSVLVPLQVGDDQTVIADTIDDQTSRIDALISKAEELIALAKERRSALITAAVTGQIDVRVAARKAG